MAVRESVGLHQHEQPPLTADHGRQIVGVQIASAQVVDRQTWTLSQSRTGCGLALDTASCDQYAAPFLDRCDNALHEIWLPAPYGAALIGRPTNWCPEPYQGSARPCARRMHDRYTPAHDLNKEACGRLCPP